jgi:hypothetical protein
MESPKSKTSHIYINKGCVSDNGVQVFAHQIKAEHDLKKNHLVHGNHSKTAFFLFE